MDRFGGKRAVVIGGSIAGLLAARVLSDHFEKVIVVERDPLIDDSAEPRKGAPQGRQLHALLGKGEENMRALFPDLLPALLEGGAVNVDTGRDLAWYHFGVWKKPFESGVRSTCVSRPFLEMHIRRRVFAIPNVERRDRCDVTGLLSVSRGARVTGVTVKPREGGGPEERIDADLVVEASGRGSKLPAWLEALGCGRPEESQVKVHLGYASRMYRREDVPSRAWKLMYVLGTPPGSKRMGVLTPIEGGRWICVLAGLLGDYPPDDAEGFLEFARGLPSDALHKVLRDLDPISDVVTHRFPANFRRHYERMPRFPEGLLVVGDSVASFNPIYGQGMTAASIGAMEIGASLIAQRRERGPGAITGLSRRYLDAMGKKTDQSWSMSTSEDYRYPEIEGQRPPLFPVMKWYLEQVHLAASVDEKIYGHFLRAMNMFEGPEKLLAPSTALRVIMAARRARAADQGVNRSPLSSRASTLPA